MFDVAIIGCGIIGASVAYQLARYKLKTVVLEAENDVSMGTTKANSGILHAGYDPLPGTLMAKLNLEGLAMSKELCQKLDIPFKQTGSLVLAFSPEELQTLASLLERGKSNGVPDLRILSIQEVRKLEPNVSEKVLGALLAPSAAVVSPWDFAIALAETAVRNGVELQLNAKVTAIDKLPNGYKLTTGTKTFHSKFIINATGLNAAHIHNMVAQPTFEIQPNKGEYFLLDKEEGKQIRHVVFQCPSKVGKGVLVAPTAHGNLIVGPNAHDTCGNDTANSQQGMDFVAISAAKSIPTINLRANIRNFAGIRALSEIDDFIIRFVDNAPNFIDVAGIKSPGLTAAPAIGKMVADMIASTGFNMPLKENFINQRKVVRFHNLTAEEKAQLVAENPAYGRIICRCETVTEGEIIAAINSPVQPRSLDAIKRRTTAGMGRCQGGFCSPRVLEILAKELKVNPLEIPQEGAHTNILVSETKKRGVAHV